MRFEDVEGRAAGRRISRRRFVKGAALGAAGIVLAPALGCQSQTTPGPTSVGPTTVRPAAVSPTAEVVTKGGTLTVLQPGDISPTALIFTSSPTNYWLNGAVHERLMHYRLDRLEAEPELAESWQFSSDYSSLTVKLRKGIRFHTGRAVTSQDVKWAVEMVADPKTASQLLNFGKWVLKMETPDEATIVMYFDQPRPSILDMFQYLNIADKETYQDTLDGKKFVGTGPFVFKEWVPGDHFTLVRNPDYWQKDRPYLDQVTVKVLPDAQTQLINLQTGAADVATSIEPRDAKDLQSDKNYVVAVSPVQAGVWYLGIDVTTPPFTDKRVRQAMAYLLDRKRIVDTLLFFGEPTVLPWDSTSPAYDKDSANKYDYDLAKAKDLLSQAGTGTDVKVTYTVSQAYPQTHGMAEVVQAEMAKVGIRASIEKLQHPEYVSKINSGKMAGVWSGTVGYMHMSPSTLFVMSFPYRVPNSSNYDTPEYRKLINDMLTTTDQAAVKKVYQQMNALLLDECFMDPICSAKTPTVLSSKVKGFAVNRGSIPILTDLWKSK